MLLTKNEFIKLSHRLIQSQLDRDVKTLIETKIMHFAFRDEEGNKVIINAYKFEPKSDEDVYTVKFHVSVNGKAEPEYELVDINDSDYGVTKNAYEEYPDVINFMVSKI